MLSPAIEEQYHWLTRQVGLVDLAGRTLVEITGADRALLLHNLCTADVKRLSAGQGCEAFFTDANAKILAYVMLFVGPESITLETIPGQAEFLTDHLDRYIFREDAQLTDRTQQWREWLLAGPRSGQILADLTGQTPPQVPLAHHEGKLADSPVTLRRVEWTETGGYLVRCAAENTELIGKELAQLAQQAGGGSCDTEALEIARVEACTPLYGKDISQENLPQEVGRDAQAISFTKGCYIGQETVARIDALGHVNRILRSVRYAGESVPPVGSELTVGDKVVGKVTSAIYSPKFSSPLALAYLRRGHEQPGTKVASPFGPAEVI